MDHKIKQDNNNNKNKNKGKTKFNKMELMIRN